MVLDSLKTYLYLNAVIVRNFNFWSERLYRGNIAFEYIRRAGPGDMSGERTQKCIIQWSGDIRRERRRLVSGTDRLHTLLITLGDWPKDAVQVHSRSIYLDPFTFKLGQPGLQELMLFSLCHFFLCQAHDNILSAPGNGVPFPFPFPGAWQYNLKIRRSCYIKYHFSIQIYVTFIDKNEWQGVRGGGGEQEQQSPRQGKRSQECRGREEKRKERECCQGVRKVKKSIQGSPKWQSRSNIYQLFCRRF